MGLCFLIIGISVVGSLFVLLNTLEAMDIRRGTLQDNMAMGAYTLSLVSVFILTVRSELKWRRSVGL
jgi:hypothetical protein